MRDLAFSMRPSFQGPMPPTNTAAEMAMHRCPAAPKAAPVRADSVASLFASGMITAWFFAPKLACNAPENRHTACHKACVGRPWSEWGTLIWLSAAVMKLKMNAGSSLVGR